jgi:hypothetical protein
VKDRTQLTIEQRRDVFNAAIQIEEASIMASGTPESGESREYSESRLNWKDWQIEFFGCIPDGARWILQAHYQRPVSETRASKGRALTMIVRELWREARKKKILWQGLRIAENI